MATNETKFKTFGALIAINASKMIAIASTFLVVFTFTYSLNETSFGGNYNLRFLPPVLRRDLRHPIKHYAPLSRALPAYAIAPAIPISLYIEGAGFLWTDPYVWDMTVGEFQPEKHISKTANFSLGDKDLENQQLRLLYTDKFNTMGKSPTIPSIFNVSTNCDKDLGSSSMLQIRMITTKKTKQQVGFYGLGLKFTFATTRRDIFSLPLTMSKH